MTKKFKVMGSGGGPNHDDKMGLGGGPQHFFFFFFPFLVRYGPQHDSSKPNLTSPNSCDGFHPNPSDSFLAEAVCHTPYLLSLSRLQIFPSYLSRSIGNIKMVFNGTFHTSEGHPTMDHIEITPDPPLPTNLSIPFDVESVH